MRSTVGRNAHICCTNYDAFSIQRFNNIKTRNWFNSTITEAFLNEILVLMELIFIRDGSFDIAGNDASLYSRDDINLFISLICTDV